MRIKIRYNIRKDARRKKRTVTTKQIKYIVRRYSFIEQAIKDGVDEIKFYVGKRREVIRVDETIKTVKQIIDDVYESEKQEWLKRMMGKIRKGATDVNIIIEFPYEKNAYYMKKKGFIYKVYACCAAKNLVTYEEILNEEIA